MSESDAEAIQRLVREAEKAAEVDTGDSDEEIELLRSALSAALARWPEIEVEL